VPVVVTHEEHIHHHGRGAGGAAAFHLYAVMTTTTTNNGGLGRVCDGCERFSSLAVAPQNPRLGMCTTLSLHLVLFVLVFGILDGVLATTTTTTTTTIRGLGGMASDFIISTPSRNAPLAGPAESDVPVSTLAFEDYLFDYLYRCRVSLQEIELEHADNHVLRRNSAVLAGWAQDRASSGDTCPDRWDARYLLATPLCHDPRIDDDCKRCHECHIRTGCDDDDDDAAAP
jgi:hypothetical protein